MKYLFTLLLLLSSIFLFSQEYCIDNRFAEIPLFDEFQIMITKDIQYGEEIGFNKDTVQLFLDLYHPGIEYDPLSKRPLLVFVHGGGFLSNDKDYFAEEALRLSKRGFVCATINYRLGWESNGVPNLCEGEVNSLAKAHYRASQDIRASLRYLISVSETYGIDTNYIYLVGASAGAISSLTSVFYDSYDFDNLFPDAFLIDSLGLMDESTNNIPTYFEISGIVSLWGGIPDISKIRIDNSIPILMLHGLGDEIIPIEKGYFYNCPEYYYLFGPGVISNQLENLDECFELNYITSGEHRAYDPDYTIEIITKFIKQLLCNQCPQVRTLNPNVNFSSEEYEFKVFPNPTLGDISIIGNIDNTDLVFEIVNIYGSIVSPRRKITFSNTTNIDIGDINKGVYFLNIFKNKTSKIFQSKIIKF